jgi:hypothetical protein
MVADATSLMLAIFALFWVAACALVFSVLYLVVKKAVLAALREHDRVR